MGLDRASATQFQLRHFLRAARLLGDAKVQAIAWAGTSGSWMGVGADRALCDALQEALGIPVTTSTLAILDAFRESGLERYSLAVPYSKDIADRIVEVYGHEGFRCAHSVFRGWNTSEEHIAMDQSIVRDLLESAVHPEAQGIAVVCTNVQAATLAEEIEQHHNIQVFDSVLVTAWKCLQMVGLTGVHLPGWGRLLSTLNHP